MTSEILETALINHNFVVLVQLLKHLICLANSEEPE